MVVRGFGAAGVGHQSVLAMAVAQAVLLFHFAFAEGPNQTAATIVSSQKERKKKKKKKKTFQPMFALYRALLDRLLLS